MTWYAGLKALHILALSIWCATLLVVPTLFHLRGRTADAAEARDLHTFTRAVFAGIGSPAAVIAVGTGTALVFVAEVFAVWMLTKLAVVGALVALHVRTGFVLLHLFRAWRGYPRWRQATATTATAAVLAAILLLVLVKPRFDPWALPAWLTTPGGLQSSLSTIVPMP
jgi:putative membrane protein